MVMRSGTITEAERRIQENAARRKAARTAGRSSVICCLRKPRVSRSSASACSLLASPGATERRGWHRPGADHPAGVALQHQGVIALPERLEPMINNGIVAFCDSPKLVSQLYDIGWQNGKIGQYW